MANNTTTNKVKKPIINNEEALRIITLIQQGDSHAENELAELGSVFVKAVAKQYYVPATSSTSRAASSLPRMPYGGCAKLFCKRFVKKKITKSERI